MTSFTVQATRYPVHPSCLRLIMDSFALTSSRKPSTGSARSRVGACARVLRGRDRLSAFSTRIHQVLLSQVKSDRRSPGTSGPVATVRNFPGALADWNGLYRRRVRRLLAHRGELAQSRVGFTGSSDRSGDGRAPFASDQSYAHDVFNAARSRLVQREEHTGERLV